MRNKKTGKWIASLLITMLTVFGLGQTMMHAEGVAEGPLTDVIITKVQTDDKVKDMTLEQLRDGVDVATYFTDGKPLQGVSFTWYSVTKEQLATMEATPASYDTAAEVTAFVGAPGTATAETGANGQVTIPNLPEGHYWVVENAKGTIVDARAVPFGLILPFTNLTGDGYLRTIHVYPKNTLTDDEPEIEKTVDESNVAIGDLNTWTVSIDIPVGIEDYDHFSFYDNIDSRLDFEGLNHVIAAADGINLIKGTDYTVNYVAPRLDVVFTQSGRVKLKNADPKKVDVTIKTRVNYTAIMGDDIENTATLEFDNGHGTEGTKEPEVPPYVHTGGRAFVKRDGNSEATLKDAEFKIKNEAGKFVTVGDSGVITFDDTGTIFKSDGSGKFEVKGLPYGNYVLVETKAPQGYALPTDPNTPFEVNATSYYANPKEVTSWETPADVIKTINNRRLVIPQTGGMGTVLFTIVGAVMMLFSAIFYKRTKEV